jgi:hypothetical protein
MGAPPRWRRELARDGSSRRSHDRGDQAVAAQGDELGIRGLVTLSSSAWRSSVTVRVADSLTRQCPDVVEQGVMEMT